MSKVDSIRKFTHQTNLKIDRAKRHLENLNELIDRFLEQNPFELWSRFKQKPPERILFVKQKRSIPDDFSLVIGDVIHNLKSGLDILAFQMVGDKAKNPAQVYFPFFQSLEKLQETIEEKPISLAGEKVVNIFKELKPYKEDGDRHLYGMHELNNWDKHRFIITVGQIAEITADDFAKIGIPEIYGPGILAFNVPIGEPIVRQPIAGTRRERRAFKSLEEKERFQPSFHICFANNQGFDGQSVNTTLLSMVGAVENAVEKISSAYFE